MWSSAYPHTSSTTSDLLPSREDTAMQRIAMHHIYEYEKGVRCMVLCTLSPIDLSVIVQRLELRGIAYYTKPTPGESHINLFFGRGACVDIIRHFLYDKHLHELSLEQDFILGTLLGYDLCGQCERYQMRRSAH